ncbi:MAG: flagellar motor switch protein FliN [Blastocatellia bacterium]|jgi:flagellar motor switch protein FliN/FliY|nr:flagellar motor switch protein FliN [Blastocatellia bacterium]
MSDSLAKQLISAVSASWSERAAALLGCPSTLSLLTSREVAGNGMTAALAVAMTWSTAFAAECTGAAGGILICLFKSDEAEEIDRLVKQAGDGLPRPGGRALIESLLEGVAATLAASPSGKPSFGPATYIDLAIDETRLAAIVKDTAEIGTFSLLIGDDINSQALVLYAANGSLPEAAEVKMASSKPPAPQNENTGPHNGTRRGSSQRSVESAPRNIERLLGVELDVVVRFGITNVPLRDVVRMGVGTMIELNRAVEEPVELLVNGRSLARGEVVVVDGYYGVRITEIGPASKRAASKV